MSGVPGILKGFKSDWYFSGVRAFLNVHQRLQVEIALIYYSSEDSVKEEIEIVSTQALNELLKIEKRKGVVSRINSELKRRAKLAEMKHVEENA